MSAVVLSNLRSALLAAMIASLIGVGPVVAEVAARNAEPIFVPRKDRWIRTLGPAGGYYPDKAARERIIPGEAVIDCVLLADASLTECRVVAETPKRYGFGEAGLRLARAKALLAAPRLVDGQRVEREVVRVKVPFAPPEKK